MEKHRLVVMISVGALMITALACNAPLQGQQPIRMTDPYAFDSANGTIAASTANPVSTDSIPGVTHVPTQPIRMTDPYAFDTLGGTIAAANTANAIAYGEPVTINPCDLVSAEQVQSVLGEAAHGTYDASLAVCVFASSSNVANRFVVVTTQGELSKVITMAALQNEITQLGDTNAQQMYDALYPRINSLSLVDLSNQINNIEATMGAQVTPIPNLGDNAFWVWKEAGKVAHLAVIRRDQEASLTVLGQDFATAQASLMPIMTDLLTNLPPNFVLAPQN